MDARVVNDRLGGDWIAAIPRERIERIADEFGTPSYLYDAAVVRARCDEMRLAFPNAAVRYAMKANGCPALLALVREYNLGIDTVSPWEVRLAREVGFRRREIIYSGNNPSTDELEAIARARVLPNLDALSALERFGRIAPGARVSLRVNLELGEGHHPHVITAGPESKFGLAADDVPRALAIARTHRLRVVGLHQHIGSGLFEPSVYLRALDRLCDLAATVPDLELLDAGGGFAVPYRPDERPVDLLAWGKAVRARMRTFSRAVGRKIELLVEPGRFLVAEAGVLLTRVTTVKRTRDRVFVGVDSGMHHLIRPALYNSYHPVRAIAPRTGDPARCVVVGPICESGDMLADVPAMAVPEEGDLLAIEVAGAYGMSMASQYNLRARPAEVLIDGDGERLVGRREKYRDLVRRWDV